MTSPAPQTFAGKVVLWLCSPTAAFTIGHALIADGGQTV